MLISSTDNYVSISIEKLLVYPDLSPKSNKQQSFIFNIQIKPMLGKNQPKFGPEGQEVNHPSSCHCDGCSSYKLFD